VIACGSIPRRFVELDGTASVSGMAFYAMIHGQRGVAAERDRAPPGALLPSEDCRREP
jgi:hypothetical protein